MKHFIKKLINRETLLYLFFGVLTTVVNYVVFWAVFSALGPKSALISNAAAFIAAVTFAFITNKLYVFESKSWKKAVLLKEMSTFLAARLLSFGIEEAGLFIYGIAAPDDLRILGMNGTLFAKIVLSVLVVIMNYFASKLIIFKNKD